MSISKQIDSVSDARLLREGLGDGETESAYQVNMRRWGLVGLLLAMLLFAAIRWRLRDMPLERDEGEYAYAGQLMLQGIPPYQIAYNMKLPGTYAAYAAIMAIGGQTPAAIHLGLMVVNILTILLMYAIGKRLYGPLAGAIAGISYGMLSVGPWVQGFAGHATHFVIFTAAIGLWLLLKAKEEPQVWMFLVAGVFLGSAFVMKQPGAAFGVFAVLYLARVSVWSTSERRKSAWCLLALTAGMAIPFALTCLLLWRAGVFPRFWFWTVTYAYQHGTNVSAAEGWHYLKKYFVQASLSAIALWILAGLGLIVIFWNRRARRHWEFLVGLLVFSGLAVSAGLYFRPHYFILLLPALSLLVAVALNWAAELANQSRNKALQYVAMAVFPLAVVVTLAQESNFYFQADPVSASRYVYPKDPFTESAAIGDYLRRNLSPSATMAMLGSEPQIMFYSRRRSVTGYLYTYSLTEEQPYAATMQRELISEVETARPDYLVHIQDWVIRPRTYPALFRWYGRYITENYRLIAVLRVNDSLQLRSEEEIRRTPGNLDAAIFLYQRTTN